MKLSIINIFSQIYIYLSIKYGFQLGLIAIFVKGCCSVGKKTMDEKNGSFREKKKLLLFKNEQEKKTETNDLKLFERT